MSAISDPSSEGISIDSTRSVPDDYEGQLGDGELIPTVIESDGDEERCPYCGEWYKGISQHWAMSSSCSWPPISHYKCEILKGIMLGDGSFNSSSGGILINSTNLSYIKWISIELGWIVGNIKMYKTSNVTADSLQNRLGDDVKAENCHDLYTVFTRAHPLLTNTFSHWKQGSGAGYPQNISPTPIAVKIWYISDGSIHCENSLIEITSVNESQEPDVVESMFNEIGFDITNGRSNPTFRLPRSQTEEFLDYIGDPIPGFEYKWVVDDREKYDRLKKESEEEYKTQTFEESPPNDWRERYL